MCLWGFTHSISEIHFYMVGVIIYYCSCICYKYSLNVVLNSEIMTSKFIFSFMKGIFIDIFFDFVENFLLFFLFWNYFIRRFFVREFDEKPHKYETDNLIHAITQ